MNFLHDNYSTFPLLSLIFASILMFLFLRFLRFVIPMVFKKRQLREILQKYFSIFELFTWILLALWFLPYLLQKHVYAGVGLIIVIFALFVWISWFGLKDLVAGFIFKTNSGLQINEHIQIGNHKGVLVKMGFRNLILDTNSGNFVSIPYSIIINLPIEKISSKEIRHNKLFELKTKRKENIQKLTMEMLTFILMHPRASLREKPLVELLKEDAQHLYFRVKIYAIENKYLPLIEEDFRKKFEATE